MSQDQYSQPSNVQVLDTSEEEEKKGKYKDCCKKALKFLFSHIGLCGMVIGYSVAGGFIFQHLEKTNEKQECINQKNKYALLVNNTIYMLHAVSTIFRTEDYQQNALDAFDLQLQTFRKDIITLGYDGTNCTAMDEPGPPGYKWSFPGALLFSVTVITTIGYGNIAPKTFWGRLACIAYACIGIPLMMLCLANIGDVMADIFRFVYTKVCCCGCCRRKNKIDSLQEPKDGTSPEAWRNEYNNQKGMGAAQPGGPVVVDDDDEEDDKISVPLTITVGVIGGYIFMGTLLFGVWEGWKPLEASYFCFVTISTIGFGDVVPGSANLENAQDQWKMVGTAVYMLFGMAILSMCFALIQEEIAAKCRWVGEKIGILEKDKPVNADEEDETTGKELGKDEAKKIPPQQKMPPLQPMQTEQAPHIVPDNTPFYPGTEKPPRYPEKFKM